MSETNLAEINRAKLNLETAQMPWLEMQRYFASGIALYVSSELDLVEVAWQMSQDKTELIKQWMETGRFAKVSDEQAAQWVETDAQLWTVVVSPWVLVQPQKT
jgi:hypothetical protein